MNALRINLTILKKRQKNNWTKLKSFVNGTKIRLKTALLVGNQIATDFLLKANLLNNTLLINVRLSTFEICSYYTVKIIRAWDPSKAHGHNEISIRKIKTCAFSISKQLVILFRNFESKCFSKEWKRANIILVIKN